MTSDEAYKNVENLRQQFDAHVTMFLQMWTYLDIALRRYDAVRTAEKADQVRTDDV